jgi:hypothetical protein
MAIVTKMYTDDLKYTGYNDNFDYKLAIFNNVCKRANLPDYLKATAFPAMLTGQALTHYFTNLTNANQQDPPFDQMCIAIRNHFENPEYKRSVLNQWNELSLRSVIGKNSSKSTEECL